MSDAVVIETPVDQVTREISELATDATAPHEDDAIEAEVVPQSPIRAVVEAVTESPIAAVLDIPADSLNTEQPEEVLSPKRALSSIVEDFKLFETLHATYPDEALAVFSTVASLRAALREFRNKARTDE